MSSVVNYRLGSEFVLAILEGGAFFDYFSVKILVVECLVDEDMWADYCVFGFIFSLKLCSVSIWFIDRALGRESRRRAELFVSVAYSTSFRFISNGVAASCLIGSYFFKLTGDIH